MKRVIGVRGGRRTGARAAGGPWWFRAGAVLTLVLLSWSAWQWRPRPEAPWFPLRYVRVEGGLQYLDVEKLHAALASAARGGYFSLDLAEVEGAVRAFAWVDTVSVARVWPDTLVVSVSEHTPVARWGDKALLNERGERFNPPDVSGFAALPAIYGPEGMERVLLDELKSLNKRLENKGLSVAMLELSKRRAYSIKLNNELDILFGRQDPASALDRLLDLAPRLGENRLPQLQRVDLRYPNGFAVVWKPAQEAIDRPPVPAGAEFHPNGNASPMARETL
ncbi:cell division protein FtsQ/DivIB [Methylococcus sp. EFPC2]|uniref:cell division protein FtsQ/DivIB n=1 Tax=Methylococcus sp. EFPC2 TaxID=2812648 RepID=UPI00196799CD|nr:cell division protein FtsQ/DivIB [Methylococcus sp. EFPC2]QSA95922.1 cell division protein FtsQ/DivIB [Methylococcus sp. EFPC2]